MNILAFTGSARKKGFTNRMLQHVLERIDGTKEIVSAYEIEAAPCKDCRYCWRKRGCTIQDAMQEIYRKIDEADLIIFSSPVYFHTVTGPLKTIIDRLQMYWAGSLRKDKELEKKKLGAILLCGGAPPFENQFLGAEIVLRGVLGDLNANCLGVVTMENTDRVIFEKETRVLTDLEQLAEKIMYMMNIEQPVKLES